jgi:hypothetical protein
MADQANPLCRLFFLNDLRLFEGLRGCEDFALKSSDRPRG